MAEVALGLLAAGGGGALGGIAGGAAMGKPNPIGPDTSIPGVKKAVLQKGGKANDELNTAQIDPTSALNYFQKAADSVKDYTTQGLGLYNASIAQAINELQPYTKSGTVATDQYLKMLGLPDSKGNAGYTGDQVTSQLRDTPGYQFQVNQGQQSIARQALAGGNQLSGATLAAASQYSQNLADTTYQNYLANLQPLMNQGQQASTNISNLYGNAGTANLNAYSNIGSAYNTAYTNAGNTWYNAAIANMQAQNQALALQKTNQNALQQQALASAPGMLNAATNAALFNYGVFQNQQGGAQYYGGSY